MLGGIPLAAMGTGMTAVTVGNMLWQAANNSAPSGYVGGDAPTPFKDGLTEIVWDTAETAALYKFSKYLGPLAIPLIGFQIYQIISECNEQDEGVAAVKNKLFDNLENILQIGLIAAPMLSGKAGAFKPFRGLKKYRNLRSECTSELGKLKGKRSRESIARKAELKSRLKSLDQLAKKNGWDDATMKAGGGIQLLGQSLANMFKPTMRNLQAGWNRVA